MNWKKVKEKQSKAWELFLEKTKDYLDEKYILTDAGSLHREDDGHYDYFNTRDLYDFFDDQGLYIGLVIGNNNMGKSQPPIFEYEIFQGGEEIAHDDDCHFIRKEAETAAFTEAFKILNK